MDISRLAQVVSGVARNLELSTNTLIVDNLKIKLAGANYVTFSGSLTAARTISMPDANVDLSKIATALQKDGSVAATANLPMGGFKLTGLAAGSAAGDSVRYEQAILASGANAFAADQSMGGFKLTNLASPISASDAATKAYVDATATGLDVKLSVRAATTANITLSGAQTIDGVSIIAGDRVLVKDQTAGLENGIYVAAAGAWARSSDADSSAEVTAGMFTFVEEGTTYADSGFVLATNNPIVLDTTALVFTQFSGAGSVNAGAGLTQTGSTLDVVSANSAIVVNANDITLTLASGSGLEISSGLKIKLEASNPSLQISSGELGIKFDPAGALSKVAAGVKANVDDSTIEISSNALQLKALGITNSHIAAAAAIDATKIADGSVSNAEFQYLGNVTSDLQTQLDNKANKSLNNLASVAINASLIAGADATLDLGSSALQWNNLYIKSTIESNIAADGSGNTGLAVKTKDQAAATGNVFMRSGNCSAGTGAMSGFVTVRSGSASGAGDTSGPTSLRSGDASGTGAAASGALTVRSGHVSNAAATGASGAVAISSGNVTGSGASGAISISTGTVGSGTRGALSLSANGISFAGAGSVSSALDIVPSADNARKLGSSSLNFSEVHSKSIRSSTDIELSANAGANTIKFIGHSEPGADSAYQMGSSTVRFSSVGTLNVTAGASQLVLDGSSISASSKQIKSVADPTAAQDAATKAYVDPRSNVISVVAGESFAANTCFAVRWGMDALAETAGRVYKADKDASSNDKFYVFAISVDQAAKSAGDSMDVRLLGMLTIGSGNTAFASADVGKPVFLTAAGAFSVTAPSAANEAVVRIGMVANTSLISVQAQVVGIN